MRAHRLRARRHPRHPGRADPHVPTAAHRSAGPGRALRADVVVPLGLDHAERGTSTCRTRALTTRAHCCSARPGHRRPQRVPHDWAALVGSAAPTPKSHSSAPNHRGPQDPAVVCPADGPAPTDCDDGAFGKGTGGQLTLATSSSAQRADDAVVRGGRLGQGVAAARDELAKALADPEAGLRKRSRPASRSPRTPGSTCPATRCWRTASRGASRTLPTRCRRRTTCSCGRSRKAARIPPPAGTLDKARWLGAGWPDYPWLFGTDGEYTAFASVATGQFADIKAHLRALRDVSELAQRRQRQGGPRGDAGRLRSTTARSTPPATPTRPRSSRAPSHSSGGGPVTTTSATTFTPSRSATCGTSSSSSTRMGTAGPRSGQRRAQRHGCGEVRQHRLHDPRAARPADLAGSKGDGATRRGPRTTPRPWRPRSRRLVVRRGRRQYADSIDDPANPANDNTKILQRHWIGVTPMDAELVRPVR